MATIPNENTYKQTDTLEDSLKAFKKRAGTTDRGKDYEHLYIANLILKLIIDNEVENFYLSSNDENFGSFDDVVLKIQFKDRTEIFALQLKHVNNKMLKVEQLNATTGNFSIEKYKENFEKEMKHLRQTVEMVLFTNCKLISKNIDQFKFGKLRKCEQNELIRSSKLAGSCHTFEANESNSMEYGDFFQNLYLYTDQPCVQQLKQCTSETFNTHFSSDESVFREYLHFITQWSMKEGKKFKLDKKWMKHVIALCVFTPFIKPLSFADTQSLDIKRKILREVVSKSELTVIDKKNFNKIEFVWSDVVEALDDIKEVNRVNKKYQLMENEILTKNSLYDKDPVKVSKLMWLLRKSPLVVEGNIQVYQTIQMCEARNLIVLDDGKNFNRYVEDSYTNTTKSVQQTVLFRKLSDLKEDLQLYEKVVNSFTYSLQGQKEAKLKQLLEICKDLDSLISTHDIVEMLEAPLRIGKQREFLPPSHVERKVTKIIIDVEFLKNLGNHSVALISCVKDINSFKDILPNLMINTINNVKLIENPIQDQSIYTCENDVSQEQFSALCEKNFQTQFHHFRYLDIHRLEWRSSENYASEREYFDELQKFRLQNEFMEYTIHESQYFNDSQQNINIICADPGMGKTTLMKSLKNNSDSSKWSIVIHARNHALHFRKVGSNVEKFVNYILELAYKECTNPLHQKLFRAMLENNQIQLIWDGLDEASDATQDAILTIVKTFSEKGVKQWLTSRNNLRNRLENTLGAFSRNIKQFDDEEQQEYIQNRLQINEIELAEIFSKIKKNVLAFPNSEILGIPLQIYMLTELFLKNNENQITLLGGIFTVVDLYEHFIDEKFHVLYEDKKGIALSNEQNYEHFEEEKKAKMCYYKNLAAASYIYTSFVSKIKNTFFGYNRNIATFLNKIKKLGDELGFIRRITSNNDAEFTHNSYGEYFAALYLFENDVSIARDKNFISNARYKNIRFFLDLMICKNFKCFVAVIYKNPTLLEECTDVDLKQKDSIGRDILEMACSWNKTHPVVEKQLLLDENGFKREWIVDTRQTTEDLDYKDVSKNFFKTEVLINVCFKKLMLLLPFLIPFYDECQFSEEYLPAILYYAITFDFVIIFECIDNSLPLKNAYNNISSRSILTLALYNRSRRILQKLFSEKRDYFEYDCVEDLRLPRSANDEIFTCVLRLQEFRIDIPNSKGQFLTHYACENYLIKTLRLLIFRNAELDVPDRSGNLSLHYACKSEYLPIIRLLLQSGAKVNVSDADGRVPMHYVCERTQLDILHLLVAHGAKMDVPDRDGRLPIHYACKSVNLNTAILLIALLENGAKINIPDRDGCVPMHYACETENLETIQVLLSVGARVDLPDGFGRLPIHYACKSGNFKAVKLLLACDAKLDVPDGDTRLPMHYACESGKFNTTELLLTNGANVDVLDTNGRLPIHCACKSGNVYTVKLLLRNGGKMDVPDGNGRLPIHYACKSGNKDTVELLLAKGVQVDVPDRDGRVPIHYACERTQLEILELLVANGAKLDIPDVNGRLPMHHACGSGNVNTVILLLENGAKIDVPDRDGRVPMHYACESGHFMKVKFLLEYGANIDFPDRDGRVPMHYACKSGNVNTVNLLLANGANINVPDRDGRMLMHYACEKRQRDIMEVLVENGAKVDVLDGDGRLPIHYACESKDLDTIKFLLANGAKLDLPYRDAFLPICYENDGQNDSTGS